MERTALGRLGPGLIKVGPISNTEDFLSGWPVLLAGNVDLCGRYSTIFDDGRGPADVPSLEQPIIWLYPKRKTF